jgi:hypothetical protein
MCEKRRLQFLSRMGNALKRSLWSREGFAIIEHTGYGWLDGGCWSLARGIEDWLGEGAKMFCVYNSHKAPQHIVVGIYDMDVFIDGRGISSKSHLCETMSKEEGVEGPTVSPFRCGHTWETENGIILDIAIARKVSSFLDQQFGDGPMFMRRMIEAFDDLPRRRTEGYAYSVHLLRRGEVICFEDTFLPHILPERSLHYMRCEVVQSLGLCEDCEVSCKCHVIMWTKRHGKDIGEKYCPVLFGDALRPAWKVKELV